MAGTSVMTGWEIVIGLEVHCELRTETKLFCSCRNAFGDEPNTNVCPVCLGLPGSLPVLNRQAVEYAIRIGTALHCTVQPSLFHRKNYFYPDMPKDYQISQYDVPINIDGWLELPSGKRIGVIRAHMEEDTGKTTHVGGGGRIHEASHSLVDYNRAGVPLVEIVSAPDMRSAEEARDYVEELRAVLIATGASDGKMEEGSLRVDCNVSVRREGSTELGTRCEIKNMNSLRSLAHAVDYEAARQAELLASGGVVAQETRHWDEADGSTHSMRSKEEAFDYRYFPEPDLVALDPGPEWVEFREVCTGRATRREACASCRGCRRTGLVRGGCNRRPPPVGRLHDGGCVGKGRCRSGPAQACERGRRRACRQRAKGPRPRRVRAPVADGATRRTDLGASPHGPARACGRRRRTERHRSEVGLPGLGFGCPGCSDGRSDRRQPTRVGALRRGR